MKFFYTYLLAAYFCLSCLCFATGHKPINERKLIARISDGYVGITITEEKKFKDLVQTMSFFTINGGKVINSDELNNKYENNKKADKTYVYIKQNSCSTPHHDWLPTQGPDDGLESECATYLCICCPRLKKYIEQAWLPTK